MSSIMRIRQARNADQIAAEIEPLAQALASLSEDLEASIQRTEESNAKTIEDLRNHALEASISIRKQVADLEKIAGQISQISDAWVKDQQTIDRSRVMWMMISSTFGALISIALWGLVFPPEPPAVKTVNIDPATVAEALKPAIIDALKKR